MQFKKYFVFLIACLMTSCAGYHSLPKISQPSLFGLSQNSTVAFVGNDDDAEILEPYCAGVFISEYLIATANHCAEGNLQLQAVKKLDPELKEMGRELVGGMKFSVINTEMIFTTYREMPNLGSAPILKYKGKVVASDPKNDLALVKVIGEMPEHLFVRINTTLPNIGDKIIATGHPDKLYFTYMSGFISAIRPSFTNGDEIRVGPFLQIYSGIYGGNSGGAIISENGELLGIIQMKSTAPTHGLAISSVVLDKLIASYFSIQPKKK